MATNRMYLDIKCCECGKEGKAYFADTEGELYSKIVIPTDWLLMIEEDKIYYQCADCLKIECYANLTIKKK